MVLAYVLVYFINILNIVKLQQPMLGCHRRWQRLYDNTSDKNAVGFAGHKNDLR